MRKNVSQRDFLTRREDLGFKGLGEGIPGYGEKGALGSGGTPLGLALPGKFLGQPLASLRAISWKHSRRVTLLLLPA